MQFARGFLNNVSNVSAPPIECMLALGSKIVSLIDCRDARDRAGLVVQDFVSNVRGDAQPSHPGHTGPTQVMNAPSRHSGNLIKQALSFGKLLVRLGSVQREHQQPSPSHAFQYR